MLVEAVEEDTTLLVKLEDKVEAVLEDTVTEVMEQLQMQLQILEAVAEVLEMGLQVVQEVVALLLFEDQMHTAQLAQDSQKLLMALIRFGLLQAPRAEQ